MSQQEGLPKDRKLRKYSCWLQLVGKKGIYIPSKHLRRITDEIHLRIPRLKIGRNTVNGYRKKEGYVRFLQENWGEVKEIALAVELKEEDVGQGPIAKERKENFIQLQKAIAVQAQSSSYNPTLLQQAQQTQLQHPPLPLPQPVPVPLPIPAAQRELSQDHLMPSPFAVQAQLSPYQQSPPSLPPFLAPQRELSQDNLMSSNFAVQTQLSPYQQLPPPLPLLPPPDHVPTPVPAPVPQMEFSQGLTVQQAAVGNRQSLKAVQETQSPLLELSSSQSTLDFSFSFSDTEIDDLSRKYDLFENTEFDTLSFDF
ncbi:hypothetical protein M9Y10_034446 [Tritrichomonas musculus]|uniref:Uncharacterized protein n=1 Tax=Tritrichomonas musculus TaxID=1915356 RepID=A0ABR2KFI0_9EUKA